MADPFSILTGTLTVGDVCLKVGKYLRTVAKATGVVDDKIKSLETEINSFLNIYESLRGLFHQNEQQQRIVYRQRSESQEDPSHKLWHQSVELVQEGLSLVAKLETLLDEIVGEKVLSEKNEAIVEEQLFARVRSAISRKYGDLRRGIGSMATTKAVRMLSREESFERIRQQLSRENQWLSTMLIAITL